MTADELRAEIEVLDRKIEKSTDVAGYIQRLVALRAKRDELQAALDLLEA